MKKVKFLFVAIFSMVLFPLMTEAKEPINVYIFKSSSCPHCAEAIEFFDELSNDSEYSSYYQLVAFETNGTTEEIRENISLAEKVSKYFGNSFSGVPLIVIGDKYYEGFGSSMEDTIKETILSSYQDDNYLDVVKGIQNGTLKGSSFDAIMSVVIVVVLILGIGYFIHIARKGVVVEEETDEIKQSEKEDSKKKNKQG